ncbi:hypothetical protein KCU65_g7791, partial [Aureobasidium melanogenum]
MAPTNNLCVVCSKPGKRCAGCENIRYCGAECQKADWKIHKLVCRTFKAARDAPGPDMVRVLEFPIDDTKPKFSWMPVDGALFSKPETGDYFGADERVPSMQSITSDPKTGKLLPQTIAFLFRDNFLNDGSLPNKYVYHLTNGRPLNPIRGPILFFGSEHENDIEAGWRVFECIDLDTTHLNVIKDWLTLGANGDGERKAYLERNSAEVKANAQSNLRAALEKMRSRMDKTS